MTTLDHLTRGRIGWNVVTTSNQASARNFGFDELPEHDDRYDIADEYMELCTRLWQSWEADAVHEPLGDITFADPSKVHPVNFKSDHFRCQGPLNAVPSPQGRPVIIQAGSSDRGRDFAARHAEVVICSKDSIDDMKAFYEDVKNRVVRNGRKETDCRIIYTFNPMVIGATEADVQRKQALFEQFGTALVEAGLAKISRSLGHESRVFRSTSRCLHSRRKSCRAVAALFRNTIHSAAILRCARSPPRKPSRRPFRCAAPILQIAERLIDVVNRVGGDGFAVRANYLTDGLAGYVADFVDHVVPILQREGYARTSYPPGTLRERLTAAPGG